MAIVQSRHTTLSIQNMVGFTTDADGALRAHGQSLGRTQGIVGVGAAVHTTGFDGSIGRAHDFRTVATDHGRMTSGQQRFQSLVPIGRGTCAHGVEHNRYTAGFGGHHGQSHALNPIGLECADVQHQSLGDANHVLHLLVGMSHHG